MFGSNLWDLATVSSGLIFGEGDDGETNLLRITSHEDLTNLYSVLEQRSTMINLKLKFKKMFYENLTVLFNVLPRGKYLLWFFHGQ